MLWPQTYVLDRRPCHTMLFYQLNDGSVQTEILAPEMYVETFIVPLFNPVKVISFIGKVVTSTSYFLYTMVNLQLGQS